MQKTKLQMQQVLISLFALAMLEKIKEIRSKFSRGSVVGLLKVISYQEARVKLKNTQLNKLKSAAEIRQG